MAIEIERRWLVDNLPLLEGIPFTFIDQYYYGDGCRVRKELKVSDDFSTSVTYTKTYKRTISAISREEIEEEIDQLAFIVLKAKSDRYISKTRHRIPHDGLVIELDVIKIANGNITIAEVELESEDQEFNPPEWFGEEITGIQEYNNYALARKI